METRVSLRYFVSYCRSLECHKEIFLMTDQHNEITIAIKFFEDGCGLKFPGNTILELFYQHYVKHFL